MANCQWTLSIHNSVTLPPRFHGVDHGFFKYIYACTYISILQILLLEGIKQQVTKQVHLPLTMLWWSTLFEMMV